MGNPIITVLLSLIVVDTLYSYEFREALAPKPVHQKLTMTTCIRAEAKMPTRARVKPRTGQTNSILWTVEGGLHACRKYWANIDTCFAKKTVRGSGWQSVQWIGLCATVRMCTVYPTAAIQRSDWSPSLILAALYVSSYACSSQQIEPKATIKTKIHFARWPAISMPDATTRAHPYILKFKISPSSGVAIVAVITIPLTWHCLRNAPPSLLSWCWSKTLHTNAIQRREATADADDWRCWRWSRRRPMSWCRVPSLHGNEMYITSQGAHRRWTVQLLIAIPSIAREIVGHVTLKIRTVCLSFLASSWLDCRLLLNGIVFISIFLPWIWLVQPCCSIYKSFWVA